MKKLISAVQKHLTDDLRRPRYRGDPNPLRGHCYVASEALFHLSRGSCRPYFIRHEGEPHWFLMSEKGQIVDPTANQFSTPVPYHEARGKGFLTKAPSKRARVVIERVRK